MDFRHKSQIFSSPSYCFTCGQDLTPYQKGDLKSLERDQIYTECCRNAILFPISYVDPMYGTDSPAVKGIIIDEKDTILLMKDGQGFKWRIPDPTS